MEKYLSITVGCLKLNDNFQSIPQSLDSLMDNLEHDEFKYVRESFATHEFDLIKQKGFYPYESRLPSQESVFGRGVCTLNSSVDCLWMSQWQTITTST